MAHSRETSTSRPDRDLAGSRRIGDHPHVPLRIVAGSIVGESVRVVVDIEAASLPMGRVQVAGSPDREIKAKVYAGVWCARHVFDHELRSARRRVDPDEWNTDHVASPACDVQDPGNIVTIGVGVGVDTAKVNVVASHWLDGHDVAVKVGGPILDNALVGRLQPVCDRWGELVSTPILTDRTPVVT